MIKAVIFDVDGVLLDSFAANLSYITSLLKKFGYNFITAEEYNSLFHLPLKDLIAHATQSNNEDEIEKIWIAGKTRALPYPFDLLRTPENLESVLESLSKKYTLAIVTSRAGDNVYSMPPLGKVKDYFKTYVSYEDTTEHKPNPEPLFLISEKLGIKPEECVYVGDSATDAIAAKAAGMKAIIYSKNKSEIADFNTESFDELPNIVEKLNN